MHSYALPCAELPLGRFKVENLEVDGTGDFAYVMGTYAITLDLGEGEQVIDNGKYLEIRKKQSDGTWLLYRDMFSSDLGVPAE